MILVILHSLNRFVLLALLLIVLYKSFMGWMSKSAYTNSDDKLSLGLFISTHTQLLLGLILYFVSPLGIKNFSSATMQNSATRYWLVEHITGMLIAIVLISIARISAKKLSDGTAKHKRIFVFNTIALVIIVAMIVMSNRGFFNVNW